MKLRHKQTWAWSFENVSDYGFGSGYDIWRSPSHSCPRWAANTLGRSAWSQATPALRLHPLTYGNITCSLHLVALPLDQLLLLVQTPELLSSERPRLISEWWHAFGRQREPSELSSGEGAGRGLTWSLMSLFAQTGEPWLGRRLDNSPCLRRISITIIEWPHELHPCCMCLPVCVAGLCWSVALARAFAKFAETFHYSAKFLNNQKYKMFVNF